MKKETGFFNQHPDLYDLMIPWEQRLAREMPFFEKLFTEHPIKSLVDCGCGTGAHTMAFAEKGIKSLGVDNSDSMIQYAQQKAQQRKSSAKFCLGDFGGVDKCIPQTVDAVVCLGNALAILPDEPAILETFKSMNRALNKKGILIFQVLNFERMEREGITFLPPRMVQQDRREYFFLRLFEIVDKKAQIKFILLTKEKKQLTQEIHTTQLFYYTKSFITQTLKKSGFGNIQMFGDVNFQPFYSHLSPDIIVVAQKE